MSHPELSNPRYFRSYLHGVYSDIYNDYMEGRDRFPRARVTEDLDELPRRTRRVANLIIRQWGAIDESRAWVRGSMEEALQLTTDPQRPERSGIVVSKVGINVVALAKVSAPEAPGEKPTLTYKELDAGAFIAMFGGNLLEYTGDRFIRYERDGPAPKPAMSGIVARREGSAMVFTIPQEPLLGLDPSVYDPSRLN